ncbi:MAG: hypothetical protein LIP28_06090, partial [Deltaproteobacteria bacterium]|nr:hypothetical protein [Deltaproteobacteria bacterium]
MATVTTTYDRYAFLTEEQRASARASLERHRTETPRTRSNAPQGDAVAFSENGRQLAATSPLSREEMEALSYAHLLAFDPDD